MRKWAMAKARRQADVNATIERKHNQSVSVLKNIAVMMRPANEDPVDWAKIYSNEEEFLEIEQSIESEESAEDSLDNSIEYEQPLKHAKSYSNDYLKQLTRGRKQSELFALSQISEDESGDELLDGNEQPKKSQSTPFKQKALGKQSRRSSSLV